MVPTFTCGFLRSNVPLAMRGLGLGYVWIGKLTSGISVGEAVRRSKVTWSPEPDLNRRPRPYQGRALPTELSGQTKADENWFKQRKRAGKVRFVNRCVNSKFALFRKNLGAHLD